MFQQNLLLAGDYFYFPIKARFAALSDKTAKLLESTDYFSNQQTSTATQRIFPPLIRCSLINDY